MSRRWSSAARPSRTISTVARRRCPPSASIVAASSSGSSSTSRIVGWPARARHESSHAAHNRVRAQLRGGLRRARLGGARALQHRRRRLRQAPARQARDDPRALRRRRSARCTWGELQDLAEPGRATCSRDAGVEQGDRVAVVLPPTPETAAIFFGAWKLGAILLSMSVLYGDDGIRHRLEDSRREGARHRRAPTPAALRADRERAGRSTTGLLDGASDRLRDRSTPRPTTRRSSTTRPARPGSPRASSTPTATCSPTRSSSTATRSRTASASTAWASGRGPRASRRCSARGASARSSASTSARAASTRTSSSTSCRRHEVTNVFTTPTAMRSMMAIEDAGTRYPQHVPPRLLGGRAAEPRGDPLVPRPVRPHGARLLRADRVLSAGAPTSRGWRSARARWAGRCPGWDVQILDEDEHPVAQGERGEICLRARSNPHYPLGYWNNDGGARGDLRRRVVPHQGRRDAGRGRLRLVRRAAPTT